jgi:transcriptional regulator with XRE-family HTH domain
MPRMSVRPRGKRIHELRSKMGIKQPQLAARARVNPRTITRVENNEATSLGTLEDLADEVRRQDREIGQTADVYSWGVI